MNPQQPVRNNMEIEQAIEVARLGLPGYAKILESYELSDTRDRTMTEWSALIGNWADTKGWNDKQRSFDEWIALFHTEISEAYEEYRNNHDPLDVYFNNDSNGVPKPEGIGVEIADLLIRVFHFAQFFGIDLNELVNLKMGYNETRAYRHGNKRS